MLQKSTFSQQQQQHHFIAAIAAAIFFIATASLQKSRPQAALFNLPKGLSSGKFGTKSIFAIAEIAANFASALQRPFCTQAEA